MYQPQASPQTMPLPLESRAVRRWVPCSSSFHSKASLRAGPGLSTGPAGAPKCARPVATMGSSRASSPSASTNHGSLLRYCRCAGSIDSSRVRSVAGRRRSCSSALSLSSRTGRAAPGWPLLSRRQRAGCTSTSPSLTSTRYRIDSSPGASGLASRSGRWSASHCFQGLGACGRAGTAARTPPRGATCGAGAPTLRCASSQARASAATCLQSTPTGHEHWPYTTGEGPRVDRCTSVS